MKGIALTEGERGVNARRRAPSVSGESRGATSTPRIPGANADDSSFLLDAGYFRPATIFEGDSSRGFAAVLVRVCARWPTQRCRRHPPSPPPPLLLSCLVVAAVVIIVVVEEPRSGKQAGPPEADARAPGIAGRKKSSSATRRSTGDPESSATWI